jgi:hypothetical protein
VGQGIGDGQARDPGPDHQHTLYLPDDPFGDLGGAIVEAGYHLPSGRFEEILGRFTPGSLLSTVALSGRWST